jgi:hypothetical protein
LDPGVHLFMVFGVDILEFLLFVIIQFVFFTFCLGLCRRNVRIVVRGRV